MFFEGIHSTSLIHVAKLSIFFKVRILLGPNRKILKIKLSKSYNIIFLNIYKTLIQYLFSFAMETTIAV